MRSMFIATESLRKAYTLLVEYAPLWMVTVIAFVDGDSLYFNEAWRVLGIDPFTATVLELLQLRFPNGQLLVSRRYMHEQSLPDLILTVLLRV